MRIRGLGLVAMATLFGRILSVEPVLHLLGHHGDGSRPIRDGHHHFCARHGWSAVIIPVFALAVVAGALPDSRCLRWAGWVCRGFFASMGRHGPIRMG